MTDYSKCTLTDLREMSNKEFEEYVKWEYEMYVTNLKHNDDYIYYSEFYRETEAMIGRRSKSYTFN